MRLLLLLSVLEISAARDRPNVVWVMADDLGWGEVGLYPSTSPHGRIATPNLDRFGKEGMVFTNAYAGYTVCAPSRTTFFTGRHSGKFVEHGLSGTNIDAKQNVTTVADVLQRAGYATGAFGKVAPLASPTQQGFDSFIGQVDQGLCHNMYPKEIDVATGHQNYNLTGNWQDNKNREACMANPESFNYTIDVFHDTGMSWLETVAKKDKPFFLYLSFTIPHAGGWGDAPATPEQGAPVPTDLQYANRSWPDVEKDHAAVITYLDSKVGDLMSRLKTLGVDDDTIVFFATDNGAHLEGGHSHLFFNSTGGLKGHKRSMFEGGTRSPTMVRWPGRIEPGQTSDFPWAFWDVMPTLAELANTNPPTGLDGISIVPTLTGEKQSQHEYLYWTWVGTGVPPTAPTSRLGYGIPANANSKVPGYAVRVGQWKGIVPHCARNDTYQPSTDDTMQLYNLTADPFETQDVAPQHPDVVASLKKLVVSKSLTCQCYQGSCGKPSGGSDTMLTKNLVV